MADSETPALDLTAAHKYFAAHCFNSAWDYMDKSQRTAVEDEQMLALAMASHWHWTQREDYSPVNASISYWQLSRVFVLLGQVENARHYAQRSLDVLPDDEALPFYRGYAYEALARAAALAQDRPAMEAALSQAKQFAEIITKEKNRAALLADLEAVSNKQ